MVIRSKLEHEIEHQARSVDSAYVMFPFLSQKHYQIDEFTSERCTTSVNRSNKQPIILLFHIWESNLEPSLQLLIGLGKNGFVRVNIASQLRYIIIMGYLRKFTALAFSPNISAAPLFKVQLMESNLQGS